MRNFTQPFYSGSFPEYLSELENVDFKQRAQKTVSKRPSEVDPYFFQPRDRSIDKQQPREVMSKLDPEQQEHIRLSINSYLINTVVQNWRDQTFSMIYAACFIQRYLVIHGGRNDDIYQHIQKVSLNDLHLYDVNMNMWLTVALHGDIPTSRWGHAMCAADTPQQDYQSNHLIIFGGGNLEHYCDSTIYEIDFSKFL